MSKVAVNGDAFAPEGQTCAMSTPSSAVAGWKARPRIALLSNPKSTGNLAQLPRIREYCADHPDVFHYEVEHASQIGEAMLAVPHVADVHDLHVWTVGSGFPSISAHVLVDPGADCHAIRSELATMLRERFGLGHSTLQVEHAPAHARESQLPIAR